MCMDEAMMERGCGRGGVDDVYRWGEVRVRARVCVGVRLVNYL